MHLVYKALEKYAIPSCLPPELLPPGKRKESISNVPVIPVTSVIPVVKHEPPKVSINIMKLCFKYDKNITNYQILFSFIWCR